MKNVLGFGLCLTLMLSVGCLSRSAVRVGPLKGGLSSEAHELRIPGVSVTKEDGACATLGPVTVCAFGEVSTECSQLLEIESVTGPTAKVNGEPAPQ